MSVNPNNLKLVHIISGTWLVLALIGYACASPDDKESFNLIEISQGIYVHKGKHVDFGAYRPRRHRQYRLHNRG